MLTKWLPRHTFEKYRNTVLNLRADRKLGIPVDCTSAPVTVCSSYRRAGGCCWRGAGNSDSHARLRERCEWPEIARSCGREGREQERVQRGAWRTREGRESKSVRASAIWRVT